MSLCLSFLIPIQASHADSLLPIISFLAGLLNQGVFPQSDAYTSNDDIQITADYGITLAVNIFVPNGLQGLEPAVIFINSWGLNDYEYLQQAADLTEKDYIVLSYSSRGWGEFGGVIATAGPEDVTDLSSVIDYSLTQLLRVLSNFY